MTSFVFVIIFGLSSSLLSCEGQIISPPDGTKLTILPGSSENITWNYVEDPPNFAARSWYFTSTDGSHSAKLFAQITAAFGLQVVKGILPRIAIIRPSTLSLNNVSQSYDGTYQFDLKIGARDVVSSRVRVFIAKKPNVTLNCSSPATLNEGDDFTCVGRGLGGNPPANVTWYKDDVNIGGTATESKALSLKNVDEADSGNYTFFAQSYPDPMYEDKKTIVVRVHFKPKETSIKFSQNPAVLGASVTIICQSRGFPQLSYNITLNGTTISAERTYTIAMVKWNDTGIYNCIATNTLGSDSASEFLNVTTVGIQQGSTTSS